MITKRIAKRLAAVAVAGTLAIGAIAPIGSAQYGGSNPAPVSGTSPSVSKGKVKNCKKAGQNKKGKAKKKAKKRCKKRLRGK